MGYAFSASLIHSEGQVKAVRRRKKLDRLFNRSFFGILGNRHKFAGLHRWPTFGSEISERKYF